VQNVVIISIRSGARSTAAASSNMSVCLQELVKADLEMLRDFQSSPDATICIKDNSLIGLPDTK
jgi:hypothetical protein